MRKALTAVLLLVAWYLVAESRIVPTYVIPPPMEVVSAFRTRVPADALATASRALAGAVMGIFLAYGVHFLCSLARIEKAMDSQFAATRAIPIIAIMPLFTIWFGFSEFARLLLVSVSAAAFFIGPFHEAYRSLPREWTLLREQLELSQFEYYRRIVILGTVDGLLGAFRVVLAVSFTMSFASEYIGAESGLGKFLDSARVTFNVPGIWLAIFVSAILGLLIDKAVLTLHTTFVHWTTRTGHARSDAALASI